MPRVTLNQTNFTAGEVSPKCYGRVDVARYQNGAAVMSNVLVNIHGGAERRSGLGHIAASKDHTKRARLIPFVFSTSQAYILEFGHLYLRVYLASSGQILSGGIPYEIATPYTEAMLPDLDFTQGADTMFLFHPLIPQHTLKRFASAFWAIQPAPITVAPFDEIGDMFPVSLTLSAATVGIARTVTASAATFHTGDKGRRLTYGSGVGIITNYTSTTSVDMEIVTEFSTTAIPSGQWTLEDSPIMSVTPDIKDPVGAQVTMTALNNAFRVTDVGKFMRINGGLVLITGFTDPTIVFGVIKVEMTSIVLSPGGAWSLESAVWNAAKGYPRTGSFYEQRLVMAGSPAYPQTVWGSRSGLVFDYTLGLNDDDAFSFSLPSTGQINPIQRMTSANALMLLTYGGETTMSGGGDSPLTPTNVKTNSPSVYGCNNVKPVRVGSEVLFVQRAGRKVRSLAYRIETDTYNAPDLTILAEHITASGVTDMAYQQETKSLVWCVRADGKMATLTLDRDEGVIAWTLQSTDGVFESVASIPNATGDEVWVVVRRTVDGEQKRYIERFEDSLCTDCAVLGADSEGKSVWGNLDHLEGRSVVVKADGVDVGMYTVTDGEVELPRNAFAVEIGLPFTSEVTVLRPELQIGDGTSQGNAKHIHEVSILLMDSIGLKINGDHVAFQEFGPDLLDVAPQLFSGLKRLGLTGWSRDDTPITITQEQPYPFHILGVVRKTTINS